MMLMTKETVLLEIQKAVPDFKVNPEWLLNGLTNPIFNDFARFICSEAQVLEFARSDEEISQLSQMKVFSSFFGTSVPRW